MHLEVAIGAVSVLFGMLISCLTFMRSRDKYVRSDATESAKVPTKLDHISQGVDTIRIDLKSNEKRINIKSLN